MHAIRAPHAYDGRPFRDLGATVLVEGGSILGIELYGHQVPDDCPVISYRGLCCPG